MTKHRETQQHSEIVIYQTEDGKTGIETRLENETVWLSQKLMSELFNKDTDTIGLHIRNIFKEGELQEEATTEYFSVVQTEGNRQVNENARLDRQIR